MMINHTIDLSIFAVPKNLFLAANDKQQKIMVENVYKAIDHYLSIKKSLDSHFFLPLFNSKQSCNELMNILENNNAMKTETSLIIEKTKELGRDYKEYHNTINELKSIIENHRQKVPGNASLKYNSTNKISPKIEKPELHSFRNRCYFQNIELDNFTLCCTSDKGSGLPETVLGENIKKSLSAIEIMNQEVYFSKDNHFIVSELCNDHDTVDFEADLKELQWGPFGKAFPWAEKIKSLNLYQQIKGSVRIKSPKKLVKYTKRNNTLQEAVEQAKKDFGNNEECLKFQTKVDISVTGINPMSGPPDKIYHYLETLNEVTKQKKANPDLPLEFLCRMYGLDHDDDESYETKRCSLAISERKLNDDDPDDIFWAHLRPEKNTRIHFKWDEIQKITRVGWIGEHLTVYKSIKEKRVNPANCPKSCTTVDCELFSYNQLSFSKT